MTEKRQCGLVKYPLKHQSRLPNALRNPKMIKTEPEDFIVEELPLYEPSGVGTHTFFAIRKRDLGTLEAINRIARELHVNARHIGYAGLKDKRAVTTQALSVEGIAPEKVLALELPAIEVLWAKPHPHKLRVGHLRGNRFEITVREVAPDALKTTRSTMERLEKEGVPNRFGTQRFGHHNDSHLIGKALVQDEWETAVRYLVTAEGDIARRVHREMARNSAEKAVASIPNRLRKLFLSAYQAHLFNLVLEQRLPKLGHLIDGDIAIKHSNGAPFLVENAAVEQPRADAFEISPSGPIFGYKMRKPMDTVQALEAAVLATQGVTPEAFRKVAGIRLPGTRRPLRMPVEGHQVAAVDLGLRLTFTLPPGGYATVVLEELKFA